VPGTDERKGTAEVETETAAPEAMVILRIANVSKSYLIGKQPVEALAPLSLEITEGEHVSFFGPSGCGKSTLLSLIAGFESPTTGEITFAGKPVERPCSDRLMLFQEHGLFPWLNVIGNVMYGLKHRCGYRFRPGKRRDTARSWLKMMDLEEFENALVHELSGGMKQRVALARALAPDPRVLLIDEPFPALDAIVRAKLYADLQEILAKTGKTVISVTHDPREAACLADRIFVFTPRPGRIQREIRVNLPRPRDINDPELGRYVEQVMAEMEEGPDQRDWVSSVAER
jgi:NitT/TauT family transport system ATP-binding protein